MVKDIIKLIVAFYVIKHFVVDNDLVEKIKVKIKEMVESWV